MKVVIAIILTVTGLVVNVIYWIVMNKAEEKTSQVLLKNSL